MSFLACPYESASGYTRTTTGQRTFPPVEIDMCVNAQILDAVVMQPSESIAVTKPLINAWASDWIT